MSEELMNKIIDGVIVGDDERVKELVREALKEGVAPKVILSDALVKAVNRVAEDYDAKRVYVAEVLLAREAFVAGLNIIRPLMQKSGGRTIIMGTIEGATHSIGKDLVVVMLQADGFNVIDLGEDVSPEEFVNAAKEHKADFIGISIPITTALNTVKEVVKLVKDGGLSTKVIIGGCAIDSTWVEATGADFYGASAQEAVKVLNGANKGVKNEEKDNETENSAEDVSNDDKDDGAAE